MTRNATPDILGEIMGASKQNNPKTSKQEKIKEIKNPNNQTAKQESNKTFKQDNPKTSKQEKIKEIKNPNNQTVKQESNKTFKQDNPKTSKQQQDISLNKEKATFNMSSQILEHLDESWFRMKKIFKSKNQRITKTLIVETSLKLSLNDFSNHLEDSEIFKEITMENF